MTTYHWLELLGLAVGALGIFASLVSLVLIVLIIFRVRP